MDPLEKAMDFHYLALTSLERRNYFEAEEYCVRAIRALQNCNTADNRDLGYVLEALVIACQDAQGGSSYRSRSQRSAA